MYVHLVYQLTARSSQSSLLMTKFAIKCQKEGAISMGILKKDMPFNVNNLHVCIRKKIVSEECLKVLKKGVDFQKS